MGQFAGILFQMDPANGHTLLLARVEGDVQPAIAPQGQLVLADLIAFRQVGIEVALAREDVMWLDRAVQGQGNAHRESQGALVDDGQHPRHAQADRADGAVRRRGHAIDHAAATEHLGGGHQLGMNLQADDGFISRHDGPQPWRRINDSRRLSASSCFS